MKRSPLPILVAALLVSACATPQPPATQAPATVAPPANWEAAYWNAAMREAAQERERGDRVAAERACGRGMRYVEMQAVKVLYAYADLLDEQRPGVGIAVRTKTQRLEHARDAQAKTGKSTGTYIGFDPASELTTYAQYLRGLQRPREAKSVEDLATAYRYAQEVNFRRSLLGREGRDPTGEC